MSRRRAALLLASIGAGSLAHVLATHVLVDRGGGGSLFSTGGGWLPVLAAITLLVTRLLGAVLLAGLPVLLVARAWPRRVEPTPCPPRP